MKSYCKDKNKGKFSKNGTLKFITRVFSVPWVWM